jgi:hypothetical protein
MPEQFLLGARAVKRISHKLHIPLETLLTFLALGFGAKVCL